MVGADLISESNAEHEVGDAIHFVHTECWGCPNTFCQICHFGSIGESRKAHIIGGRCGLDSVFDFHGCSHWLSVTLTSVMEKMLPWVPAQLFERNFTYKACRH